MVKLTILYSYFGQQEMVKKQIKEWKKYQGKADLVYVDDCSKVPLMKPDGVTVYRVLDDIKWNQGGARNLGMSKQKGWVIVLDMDYLVTEKNIEQILSLKPKKGTVYYFGRTGEPISYTLYLIHSDDFKKTGGYDEDFSGHYGWEDALLNRRIKDTLNRESHEEIKIQYFPGESSGGEDSQRNKDLLNWKLMFPERTKKNISFKWKTL